MGEYSAEAMNQKRYVLVPIVHGVQLKDVGEDFAVKFIAGIEACLNEQDRGYFVPIPINWSKYTNERQMLMFRAVEHDLGRQWFRKLKHTVGSDVTWTARAKPGTRCFMDKFYEILGGAIGEGLAKYPNPKICIIGHSQGSQDSLCYIFDAPRPTDAFISMGSPISMNSGAFEDWGQYPPKLGRWVNFFHYWDFISSRLGGSHLSAGIREKVEDIQAPSGFNPLGWTIAGAHSSYWTSKFVHKKIAEILCQVGGWKT